MTIGGLGFLNPGLLLALVALPVIWWLLRATPPAAARVRFPAIRILHGLASRQETPARSPWWLTLIRMLAAAAIIAALAGPVLNPDKATLSGSGPVVILVDDGWPAAGHWPARRAMLSLLIDEAAGRQRPVMLVPAAAGLGETTHPVLESAKAAHDRTEALEPKPYAPDRLPAIDAARRVLEEAGARGGDVVWLSDGIDHGDAGKTAEKLSELAGGDGRVVLIEPRAGERAIGLRTRAGAGSALEADVLSPGGESRSGLLVALSGRGQALGEARFALSAGTGSAAAKFDLPLELRNQVARIEIAGERSAGAVHLLDSSKRWNRIGLASGSARGEAQLLLSPLHYIERALAPYADLLRDNDANTADAITRLLGNGVSVLMLTDIGRLADSTYERVATWVEKGGVLVRFAGPRLEQGGDDLLPVTLRVGGRTLGGALSWSVPQQLQPFEESSLFAGLKVPSEVTVNRQVLADPAFLSDTTQIWARLTDGTPLVTAQKRKGGWVVLFHVTGNSDWSNLPLSGLFVEMMQRLTSLTGLADVAGGTGAGGESGAAAEPGVLPPVETLDGYGRIGPPPASARAIGVGEEATVRAGAKHPPGLYGTTGRSVALNAVDQRTSLAPIGQLGSGVSRSGYRASTAYPLEWAGLTAALLLVFADILAVLALQAGLLGARRAPAAAAALAAAVALAAMLGAPAPARAQDASDTPRALAAPPPPADDRFALEAALKSRLAYVLTGNATTDESSRLGLQGLGQVLIERTAFEPADPIGVDVERDELGFFPVLYWPIDPDAREPSEAALARVDAYMKGGGLIIFDTRDFDTGLPALDPTGTPSSAALQRILGKLDVPALEPAPPDHVLTKSFYLIRSFPGRFEGGTLWVEAEVGSETSDARRPRRSDGVSSLIITSNDLAGAWAIDEAGRPLFPVVPGGEEQREWAYRVGVNIVMYALTGNYKADQVHVPALLERLGQ